MPHTRGVGKWEEQTPGFWGFLSQRMRFSPLEFVWHPCRAQTAGSTLGPGLEETSRPLWAPTQGARPSHSPSPPPPAGPTAAGQVPHPCSWPQRRAEPTMGPSHLLGGGSLPARATLSVPITTAPTAVLPGTALQRVCLPKGEGRWGMLGEGTDRGGHRSSSGRPQLSHDDTLASRGQPWRGRSAQGCLACRGSGHLLSAPQRLFWACMPDCVAGLRARLKSSRGPSTGIVWSSRRPDCWRRALPSALPGPSRPQGRRLLLWGRCSTSGSGLARHRQSLCAFCCRNGQGSGEPAAGELTASRNQVRTLLSSVGLAEMALSQSQGLPAATPELCPLGFLKAPITVDTLAHTQSLPFCLSKETL